jgi:hypothetical protein
MQRNITRRVVTIWFVVAAVIGGLLVNVSTASAAPAWCHDPQLGGTFICDNNYGYGSGEEWQVFPDGSSEVFVVGQDFAVWTRWNVGANPGYWYPWTSLGGRSLWYASPGLAKSGEYTWHPTLIVEGTDYRRWYRVRHDGGGWSAWYCCYTGW